MQWIHELEQHAVAFARLDGGVVDCNRRFNEVVLGRAEAKVDDLLKCLRVTVDDLELGPRGQKRRVETQLTRSPGLHVALTISSAHAHGEGLLRIELEDETPRIRAEEQFTWIIESSFDGFWDWHIKEDYEYMSPQFWRMFGYEPHEKEHKPSAWQDMVNQDDLKEALVNFAKHIETRGEHPYLQEVRYTHKDGSTVWVRCKGRVVEYDDQGGAVRMVGTHTDITRLKEQHAEERKLVEVIDEQNKRLQRRADEMHDLVYRANAPVIGFDTAGRVTEWNHRVAELTGKEEDDVVGTQLASLEMFTPESLEVFEHLLERTLAGEWVSNLRLSLRCAQGAVDILVNSSARKDPKTLESAGGFLLGQDLTEVMLAKEGAVSAACEARAEKKLNEYMAHEVRNPVFSAQAAAKFLVEFFESPELAAIPKAHAAAEDAVLIVNNLDYVFELLSSLLDLNKFLEGSLKYETQLVDFRDRVLKPVEAMVRRRASKGVKIFFECAEGVMGCCDETRIKQVIMNLVTNALKFTRVGFVRVRASKDADDQLCIAIEDSGVGVPAASASKLFKRFSQIAGHDQGSGIGLYLSRLVIHRIGGELWLDQSYSAGLSAGPGAGPGARFCLTIPFANTNDSPLPGSASSVEAQSPVPLGRMNSLSEMSCSDSQSPWTDAEAALVLSAAPKASLSTTVDEEKGVEEEQQKSEVGSKTEGHAKVASAQTESASRKRLLLVDDDTAVRVMMARILERVLSEMEIVQAVCGEDALKLVEDGAAFDVIVMDQYMSHAGGTLLGTETVAALRERGCDSLIIGLSGNDVADEYFSAGADVVWRKPMTCRKQILSDVEDGLAKRRMSNAVPVVAPNLM